MPSALTRMLYTRQYPENTRFIALPWRKRR
jgi:hypothetical protein